MWISVSIVLLLSISGNVQSLNPNLTAAADCQSAMNGLEAAAGHPNDHLLPLLAVFPKVGKLYGLNLDAATAAQKSKTPREALNEFSIQVNRTARVLLEIIDRCSRTPWVCPPHETMSAIDYVEVTPDVLWALAEVIKSNKSVDYLNILVPVIVKRLGELSPPVNAVEEAKRDIWNSSQENSTVACVVPYGRKLVCRYAQLLVPLLNGPNGNNIVQTYGQHTLDLALEFQKDAIRALRCSEFGDFVRKYDWLSVNYRASGSAV